jgi:hypothetical protein
VAEVNTYSNANKLHSAEAKPESSYPGKNADESHRIAVKLKSDGLRVEHGPD